MKVSLVMSSSGMAPRYFAVNKQRVIVGRKNTCDLRIPLLAVSRQHCEITIELDQVRVRDLGSKNGTYRNYIRIQETVLLPGDQLRIGPVVFTIVVDGRPDQIDLVHSVLEGNLQRGTDLTLADVDGVDPKSKDLDGPVEALEPLIKSGLADEFQVSPQSSRQH